MASIEVDTVIRGLGSGDRVQDHGRQELGVWQKLIQAGTSGADVDAYRAAIKDLQRLSGAARQDTSVDGSALSPNETSELKRSVANVNSLGTKAMREDLVGGDSLITRRDVSAGSRKTTQMAQPTVGDRLNELAPPDPSHPYAQEVAQVRADLKAKGLPTDASGVRMVAVDMLGFHGSQVTRAAAGPAGLAQGADLSLRKTAFEVTPELREERRVRGAAISSGNATFDDVVRHGLSQEQQSVENLRFEVARTRQELPSPPDGKATIMNASWGKTRYDIAGEAALDAMNAPQGSKLYQEVTAQLGHAPSASGSPGYEEDLKSLRSHLIDRMDAQRSDPVGGAKLAQARKMLEDELAAGRKDGLLVFASAGNEYAEAVKDGRPEASRSSFAGVKGLMLVGATNTGAPNDPKDNRMAAFSSNGATLSAPGDDLPIAKQSGSRMPGSDSGTSFASPVAASVAALMVKANPQITPDQIEQIMVSTARDIPGTTRDGAGEIDAVRAVEAARLLRR